MKEKAAVPFEDKLVQSRKKLTFYQNNPDMKFDFIKDRPQTPPPAKEQVTIERPKSK